MRCVIESVNKLVLLNGSEKTNVAGTENLLRVVLYEVAVREGLCAAKISSLISL